MSHRIGLAGPATVIIKDGGADLRNLSLSLSGGRLTIDGRAGSKLDLKAIARAVPLSAADILAPDLGLSGSLDGEATVTGPLAAPAGAYRFKIAKLAAPQTRTIGLPLIDVDATGRFEGVGDFRNDAIELLLCPVEIAWPYWKKAVLPEASEQVEPNVVD